MRVVGQFEIAPLGIRLLRCHLQGMATDRFDISLKCPKCGRVGIARAEEEDGWAYVKGNTATTITDLPDGFRIVRQQSRVASVDIFCGDCNVSAVV
jgi:hypothetical protein